MTVINRHRTH